MARRRRDRTKTWRKQKEKDSSKNGQTHVNLKMIGAKVLSTERRWEKLVIVLERPRNGHDSNDGFRIRAADPLQRCDKEEGWLSTSDALSATSRTPLMKSRCAWRLETPNHLFCAPNSTTKTKRKDPVRGCSPPGQRADPPQMTCTGPDGLI
jgi:hypothetical protein